MSHTFEKLIDVISALESALEKQDWEDVTRLDLTVRPVVTEYTSLTLNDSDRSRLGELLLTLQSLYDRLSNENLGRRTALGSELNKLHKEHNAISQYIQSSGY